jgi:AraC family transcriptional activator FtrA
MFLHLIRRDHDARTANMVAQRLVIPPHRDGGQAQFIPRPVPDDDQGRLSKLLDWLRARPAQAHTLQSLARRASMSIRTLQRKFRESTGMSPHEWLTRERVAIAKELLESSRMSLLKVAEKSGFTSPESFRRHFRLIAETSPSAYRQRFRG